MVSSVDKIFSELKDYAFRSMDVFDLSLARLEFIHNSAFSQESSGPVPRLTLLMVDIKLEKVKLIYQDEFPEIIKAERLKQKMRGDKFSHLIKIQVNGGEILIRCRDLAVSKSSYDLATFEDGLDE